MKSKTTIFLSGLFLLGSCSESPEAKPEALGKSEAESNTVETDVRSSKKAPPGMVLIPGGTYQRGGDAGEMGGGSMSHQSAYPIHEVQVDAFWIDETEVTNREFTTFVEATGYKTFAERPLPEARVRELEEDVRRNLARLELMAAQATGEKREEILASMERIRKASKTGLEAGAIVFAIPQAKIYDPNDISQWWKLVPGANWKTPGGPGTTLEGLEDHPVVNVTYEDAAAYAKWAGKRLPTEAEWEKAARGGLARKPYTWGDELFPEGEGNWMANIWQGEWPQNNSEEDGFFTTSPVKSFPANGYGLYDMSGNVWEIVADYFHPNAYHLPSATQPNPQGPPRDVAVPKDSPVSYRVTKGGSFLCSDVWCKGYQPGSRQQLDNESPSNHTGFRCAKDVEPVAD